MTKIHHAAIDGGSGAELATAIHDIEPEATVEPPEKRWVPEADPSLLELTIRATANNIRSPFRLARTLTRNASGPTIPFRSDPTEEVEGSADASGLANRVDHPRHGRRRRYPLRIQVVIGRALGRRGSKLRSAPINRACAAVGGSARRAGRFRRSTQDLRDQPIGDQTTARP